MFEISLSKLLVLGAALVFVCLTTKKARHTAPSQVMAGEKNL